MKLAFVDRAFDADPMGEVIIVAGWSWHVRAQFLRAVRKPRCPRRWQRQSNGLLARHQKKSCNRVSRCGLLREITTGGPSEL